MNKLLLKSIFTFLLFLCIQSVNFAQKKLQLKIVSDSINTSIKEGKYILEGKVTDGKYSINEVYIESTNGKWVETGKTGLFKIELDTSDQQITFKKKGYENFVFEHLPTKNQQHIYITLKAGKNKK